MSDERILVIENEPAVLQGLKLKLTAEGYRVIPCSRGDDGVQRARTERPDLVLVDTRLPGLNGLDVCRELRHTGFEAPIVMLSARSDEIDRVMGLELGADDYVTKPFGVRELIARIRARLRRRHLVNGCSSIVRFGEITFDFERQKTDRNGRRIELTDKEVKILRILIEHKGQTVTRDCLLRQVWGQAVYVTVRTVDNHILRLRQKLETDPAHPRHILSAYGEGYKFCG